MKRRQEAQRNRVDVHRPRVVEMATNFSRLSCHHGHTRRFFQTLFFPHKRSYLTTPAFTLVADKAHMLSYVLLSRTMGGPKGRRRVEQGFLGAEHFLTPEGKLKVGSPDFRFGAFQRPYCLFYVPKTLSVQCRVELKATGI